MRVSDFVFLLSELPQDLHICLPSGVEPKLVLEDVVFGDDPEDTDTFVFIYPNNVA